MRGLRATNNVKEIGFKGVWGELESKKIVLEKITHKIFETNSSVHAKLLTTGRV